MRSKPAPVSLTDRVRAELLHLQVLEVLLRQSGRANLADAAKRARRELEVVERQGLLL